MINKTMLLTAGAVALLGFTGCKTVVRENIISSINTGIGVSLAENPKTEMYEVKVGYIRSQFYSVPTGKNVEDTSADGKNLSNRANITPELVSGIRMESDARHLLLGVSVSESFAVGKVAVMSPAAAAMYIADARNKNNAAAASTAAKSVAEFNSDNFSKTDEGDCLRNYWKPGGTVDATHEAALKQWMTAHNVGTPSVTMFLRGGKYQDARDQAIKDLNINCQ